MEPTRTSLLVRIKDPRDSQSWREFDSIYRPMLQRFARARGLDEAAADDVVQFCMANLAGKIKDFHYQPSKGHFRGWLSTMVENHIRTLARKPKQEQIQTQHLRDAAAGEPSP